MSAPSRLAAWLPGHGRKEPARLTQCPSACALARKPHHNICHHLTALVVQGVYTRCVLPEG